MSDIWYHLFEKCSAMELGNKILTGKHLMDLTKFLFEFLRKKTLHSGSAKKVCNFGGFMPMKSAIYN